MKTINSKKLGLAAGITWAILYLLCMCLMGIIGKSSIIWLFNSLLHGLDVGSIAINSVPFIQSIVGLVLSFVIGWLAGYLIGRIYNWST